MRLQDLKVGQTIRTTNHPSLASWIRGYTGTVTRIDRSTIWIAFDPPVHGRNEWSFGWGDDYFALPMTPEEQEAYEDQKRREAHADRWL